MIYKEPFQLEKTTGKWAASWENLSSSVSTRSDTNRGVQPQKMVRDLKFRIYKVEDLYCPFSENKGADQLRGYITANLRLCFREVKKAGFLMTRLKSLFNIKVRLHWFKVYRNVVHYKLGK